MRIRELHNFEADELLVVTLENSACSLWRFDDASASVQFGGALCHSFKTLTNCTQLVLETRERALETLDARHQRFTLVLCLSKFFRALPLLAVFIGLLLLT